MPTQKTRISGEGPEAPESSENQAQLEQDLGLTENAGNIIDDPSGFVARTEPEEMYGRRVRPMPNSEIERAHRAQAGDVPMFGPPSLTGKDGEVPQRPQQAPQQQQADPAAQQKAEAMMPDYMKEGAAPAQSRQQQPVDERHPTHKGGEPSPAVAAAQEALFNDSANMIQHLLNQEADASNRGDYAGAAQARQMAEKIADEYEFERVVQPRKEHPALSKLKANLGLEQIKPAHVDWAGSKWLFAATNARLDRFVSTNLRDEGLNIVSLMISATLVGVDDVPIYDFLSVPLTETHTVTKHNKEGDVIDSQAISVSLFRKYCDCGVEVNVGETECFSCKAKVDPYEIPTDLRLLCAEKFYKFLEEDFGPYEELPILLERRNELMKDRHQDKQELFPLASSSQEAKTTTSSQSGDES